MDMWKLYILSRQQVTAISCDICVSQIIMTTGRLLLLVVFLSSRGTDSQSSDDEVCDGEDGNVCYEEQLFEMTKDVQKLQMGKCSSTLNTFCVNFCFQPKLLVTVLELVHKISPHPSQGRRSWGLGSWPPEHM